MTANVQALALLVKAAYRAGMREMNAALADLGLTAPQAEALAVLAQAGPLSLNQLGGLLIAEGGHPSRMVDRLVSAGWVARHEAAEDRRRVTLQLTPAGARLHEQAVQRTAPVLVRFAERVDGEDVAAACAVLAASLRGTDLAEVVNRRLAGTADTTASGRPASPPAAATGPSTVHSAPGDPS
jgi:MarR family transcriptional regulator, organic hydroperoxide resistance regulator